LWMLVKVRGPLAFTSKVCAVESADFPGDGLALTSMIPTRFSNIYSESATVLVTVSAEVHVPEDEEFKKLLKEVIAKPDSWYDVRVERAVRGAPSVKRRTLQVSRKGRRKIH